MLINGDEERNASTGAVRLMTIHNAKGLEFDYVFVLGLNEGVFPTKKAINEQSVAEERRLMYVAMTRAQKQLFLSEAGGITNGAVKLVALPMVLITIVQASKSRHEYRLVFSLSWRSGIISKSAPVLSVARA